MSAQFVARVLSYCLGKGSISLKGSRKRPWLELKRSETERIYLGSQVYLLRQDHPSQLEVVWDRVATDGFYDLERARIQTDELWRAYDLLYPRDEFTLSREVLDLCGITGLATLWLDSGCWVGLTGEIRGRHTPQQKQIIAEWIRSLGFPAEARFKGGNCRLVLPAESMRQIKPAIRPHVHQTMRHKLLRKMA